MSRSAQLTRRSPNVEVSAEKNSYLVPLLVALAIMLGGASTPTSWSTFALQCLAAVLLVTAILRADYFRPVFSRGMAWLASAAAMLVLLHLAPLPPAIWTELPGRDMVEEGLVLAGVADAWLPLSLAPNSTVALALKTLPLFALIALLATSQGLHIERTSMVLVAVAIVSFAIGVFQVSLGSTSILYFHEITNRGSAVGFFANANHLATLLLISVPLATALSVEFAGKRGIFARYPGVALAVASGVAALGISLTGSVAGIILLPIAVISSLFMVGGTRKSRILVSLGSLILILAAVALSVGVLNTSFSDGQLSRVAIWRTSLEGVTRFWPVGSGLGSFSEVYELFEDPRLVTATFVNHAHNDYLELVFEAGLPGVLLILMAVGFWVRGSMGAWRNSEGPQSHWLKASSIVIGLFFAHSVVDYPLRTPALLVVATYYGLVLGKACGTMASGRRGPDLGSGG